MRTVQKERKNDVELELSESDIELRGIHLTINASRDWCASLRLE
jgi:hypothetical protein